MFSFPCLKNREVCVPKLCGIIPLPAFHFDRQQCRGIFRHPFLLLYHKDTPLVQAFLLNFKKSPQNAVDKAAFAGIFSLF